MRDLGHKAKGARIKVLKIQYKKFSQGPTLVETDKMSVFVCVGLWLNKKLIQN
jgi:hypothetical protein